MRHIKVELRELAACYEQEGHHEHIVAACKAALAEIERLEQQVPQPRICIIGPHKGEIGIMMEMPSVGLIAHWVDPQTAHRIAQNLVEQAIAAQPAGEDS